MAAEFDQYVASYKDIINRGSAITGESYEYFIHLRVRTAAEELTGIGTAAPRRVLDFGCGIGETERVLREHFPGAELDAVDPSPESIKAARGLGVPGATFHESRGVALPFADSTFDLIYSNGTFHHIDHGEHPAVFGELARVLAPGGHMFIFENNPLNPLTVLGMRRNPFDRGTKMLFPWYLRDLQKRAGMRVTAPRYYVFFPKQLKALRPLEKRLRQLPLGAQYYVWGTKPA
jgi:ubiquinone/menaquinone biosynthesis C-methylase UbiE